MEKQNAAETAPEGTRKVVRRSGLPILIAGAVWPVWALLFPFYKAWHYLVALGLSFAVYCVLAAFIKDRVTYEEVPHPSTGNAQADELLSVSREQLAAIRRARAEIADGAVAGRVERVENLTEKILAFAEKNPSSVSRLRRFMNYYLPTLQKLVVSYEELEEQGVRGENIEKTMEKIRGMLETVEDAFRRQLDALYGDVALDISTDITVMENLMAREGLSENK